MLRFFGPEAETVVEEWDNNAEELVSDRIVGGSGTRGVERRRRSTKEVEGSIEASGGTVVSDEYLKGLDKELAPYSEEIGKEWNKLVGFVTEETVARVVGLDEKGNGKVDAVMGSLMDEKELKAAGGKRTWGKKREEEKVEGQEEEGAEGEEEEGLELLRFVEVDVKRSWPKGAVGEDLTRWSQDKSWCLSDAVDTKLGGGALPRAMSFRSRLIPHVGFAPRRHQGTPSRTSTLLHPFHPATQLLFSHNVQIPLLPHLSFLNSRPSRLCSTSINKYNLSSPLHRNPPSLRLVPLTLP